MMSVKKNWLVTGCAGFIGSSIVKLLLEQKQSVIGLDNLSTGNMNNIEFCMELSRSIVGSSFVFYEGDIADLDLCIELCKGADYVLHQAAFVSVPKSIKYPVENNLINVDGFLNVLTASKLARVEKFVYASSSAVYGNNVQPELSEELDVSCLSPYAVSKYVNELYAENFSKVYGLKSVGLRYFNVYGPRQDKNSGYAAVIPAWITALLDSKGIVIFGDGLTTRDFIYVEDIARANILSAVSNQASKIINVGSGRATSLIDLAKNICDLMKILDKDDRISFRDFREGDVRHSLANIDRLKGDLNFQSKYSLVDGLLKTVDWYRCQ